MTALTQQEDRNVIPRWRTFDNTQKQAELPLQYTTPALRTNQPRLPVAKEKRLGKTPNSRSCLRLNRHRPRKQ